MAYGLREKAEVASIQDALHEGVVWHAARGDIRGRDEVLAMLAESDEMAARTISREIHALFADADHGVVLTTVRARRDERRLENLQVHVYRFVDGRVAEFWMFLRDQQDFEEFWSPSNQGKIPGEA